MAEQWATFLSWSILALAGATVALPLVRLARSTRVDLLGQQPWRPNTLGGGDVVLIFLFILFVPAAVLSLVQSTGFFRWLFGDEPKMARQMLWVMVPALPLTLLGIFPILYSRNKVRPQDIGVSGQRWPHNVLLGYGTWLVITPLILGLHLVLVPLVRGDDHPLAKLTQEQLWPVERLLIVFQAVVFAPLIEEVSFRGVLQSWLYQTSRRGHLVAAVVAFLLPGTRLLVGLVGLAFDWLGQWLPDLAALAQTIETQTQFKDMNHGSWIFILALLPCYAWTLRGWRLLQIPSTPMAEQQKAPSLASGETNPPMVVSDPEGECPSLAPVAAESSSPPLAQGPNAFPAVFGSALLFAATHASVWPSPIPLFFLGLALGWLAYRTQSLIGPVVVHALFNAVACLVLALTR